ncbi:hypothetical protein [Gaoshiqia sediminis]|uniref:Uncharacterized protein n=1 Tax=Gaoshiqia sediminis TaxID=2986998 RepID=A0AA41Y6R5_9BACT|nr:hypothetical protein [Gaoshiqia sediminis]MCW0484461.1 hypothetical protein [Gaoshiqia sediminis]
MKKYDMAEKEIALLNKQVEKLADNSFDLEAWKKQTLLFLTRIFGPDHPVVKMISDLKYDYSSWHLRDATGNEKTDDPVKMQAREILDAAVLELETLGIPGKTEHTSAIWDILEDELTGKQIKELKEIMSENISDRAQKISEKLNALNKENLINILSRIMIS